MVRFWWDIEDRLIRPGVPALSLTLGKAGPFWLSCVEPQPGKGVPEASGNAQGAAGEEQVRCRIMVLGRVAYFRAWAVALWLVLAGGTGDCSAEAPSSPPGSPRATQSITLQLKKAQPIVLPVDVRDVLVADAEIAEVVVKTPRLVYLIGMKTGDTNAFFLDADNRQVLKLDIAVERDITALRSALTAVAPNADIDIRGVKDDVVLTGTAPTPAVAETIRQVARRYVDDDAKLVNMINVNAEQQVVIRIKVAEMQRTVAKKLGFRTFFQNEGLTASIGEDLTDAFGTGTALGLGTGFSAADGSVVRNGLYEQFFTSMQGLETNGFIKTLAEPNLTAVSGQSANFLVGGEFPVIVGRDSTGIIQIVFKQFGVGIDFTPVVLNSGRISLKISTEVSDISKEVRVILDDLVIPGIDVRRASTTVEMASGSSIVLAGMLRSNIDSQVNAFPWLKDIPILGALFRSTEFQKQETELVVIASPILVRPTTMTALTAPTDNVGIANDLELFFLDGLYSRYGGETEGLARPGTGAPVGYILR